MYKEILISVEEQEKRVAILENKILEEFYVERQAKPRIVGNIYKGRVSSIVGGLEAAFIDAGLGRNGFIHVSDTVGVLRDYETFTYASPDKGFLKNECKTPSKITDVLKQGQEVLVQVVKEPIGKKGVRLTTNITLPGRFLVLMTNSGQFGVSRKIESEQERSRLKDIVRSLRIPPHTGLIVRTAGTGCSKAHFARDLKYLLRLWKRIGIASKRSACPSLIHEEHGLLFRIIRDSFTEDVNKLTIDSKQEYKRLVHFVNNLSPNLRQKIEFYRGIEPLFAQHGIETEIEKTFDRKTLLKSGVYIVTEQTEGLVAIDVNSGKFSSKRSLEETVFAANMEAAGEIARQVRLRDMGGIIVIDFIDMSSASHRQKVFAALKEAMKRDKAKTNILTISELGLVEMTRQRVSESLESATYQNCPYCKGRGSVKSIVTMAIFVIRQIKKTLKSAGRRKQIAVCVHPDVASYLFNQERQAISLLEAQFRSRISIKPDSGYHIEQVEINIV